MITRQMRLDFIRTSLESDILRLRIQNDKEKVGILRYELSKLLLYFRW